MNTYEHPGTLIPRLARAYRCEPFESLLDIGGGGGIVGLDFWGIDRNKIHVLDIFPPETPWRNFKLGDALDAEKLYGAKSFDVVQCCEVIEHLQKEKGPELLDVFESVAKKLVILTTPNGFLEQDPADHPRKPWARNPYQRHLCGYSPEDFKARGYEVYLNAQTQIVAWKSPH